MTTILDFRMMMENPLRNINFVVVLEASFPQDLKPTTKLKILMVLTELEWLFLFISDFLKASLFSSLLLCFCQDSNYTFLVEAEQMKT